MTTIQRFEDVEAWQTARALTRQVYSISMSGAFSKDFALRDQMRRAAVSVMSNTKCSGEISRFSSYLKSLPASQPAKPSNLQTFKPKS